MISSERWQIPPPPRRGPLFAQPSQISAREFSQGGVFPKLGGKAKEDVQGEPQGRQKSSSSKEFFLLAFIFSKSRVELAIFRRENGPEISKRGLLAPLFAGEVTQAKGKNFSRPDRVAEYHKGKFVFSYRYALQGGARIVVNCGAASKGFFALIWAPFASNSGVSNPGRPGPHTFQPFPRCKGQKPASPGGGGSSNVPILVFLPFPRRPPKGGGVFSWLSKSMRSFCQKPQIRPLGGGGGQTPSLWRQVRPGPKPAPRGGGGIPTRFSRQVPCTHKGSQPTLLKKGRKMEDFFWSGSRFLLKIV